MALSAVTTVSNIKVYTRNAADAWPTVGLTDLISIVYELDTNKVFEWDGDSWCQIRNSGATFTLPGTGGGSTSVTTLENFVIADGVTQEGTTIPLPSGRVTIQAVANGSSGAFAATVTIKVSNDNTNFITLGTITLSGTATTADFDGFASDAPWAYIRADISSFSGTLATCDITMGV